MTAQPTHDTTTLKNVTGESGSILLLNSTKNQKKPVIEPVQPSGFGQSSRDSSPRFSQQDKQLRVYCMLIILHFGCDSSSRLVVLEKYHNQVQDNRHTINPLRSFLPKIASANQELNRSGGETLDVDVTKVESDIDESDTSTDDADSSEELESNEDEKPKVEFNLSLFRADKTGDENGIDLKPEVEQVPEGFRETGDSQSCDSPVGKKPKRLVEEL